MFSWPLTLPQRLSTSDFSDSLPDNVIVTTMDAGPPKRRRKTTANIRTMTGSMVMTTAEWNALVTFFQDTIKETLPFELPTPDEDGGTLSVVFGAPPQRQYFGPGRWRVSLKFEVQP